MGRGLLAAVLDADQVRRAVRVVEALDAPAAGVAEAVLTGRTVGVDATEGPGTAEEGIADLVGRRVEVGGAVGRQHAGEVVADRGLGAIEVARAAADEDAGAA